MQVAVLSTKDAYKYVGNQMIWQELLGVYGQELKPIRTASRGDRFWLRSEIDKFLIRAQLEESLVREKAA